MNPATSRQSPNADPQDIQRALSVLFEPRQVVELRAFRGRRDVTTGYFDDHELLAQAAVKLARTDDGVYVTLQSINPALLARRWNRVEAGGLATSDNDVLAYRWIPLDFDPARPADISSTDAEHRLALERASAARDWAVSEGFERYVVADSGNGAHLLLRMDVPVSEKDKVQRFLARASDQFSDEAVKVDTAVFNPARIWKLYGTRTRKGDDFPGGANNPARPHRLSRLIEVRCE